MYERFFGFRDQPFRLTPDPKYLYLGSKHREGYAHLLYALREGSGFVAVTGEVGTGKTTLVRALLRESHEHIALAYIFNPVLSSVELLQTINAELGLPSRSTSKKELIEALNNFLLAQKADGGRAVIIIDEAQNLDPSVLEQLRLLSNLETETDKLVQIILLGQPELQALLDRPDLRQLSQRVSLRWHLDSLDRNEVHQYVRHRLQVAGGNDGMFDPRAIDLVYELSGGVPRLINILSHRSLLVAYTKGAKRISTAEVQLAAVELEQCRIPLRARTQSQGKWLYKVAAGVAVAVVAAGMFAFLLVAPLGDERSAAEQGLQEPGARLASGSKNAKRTEAREPERDRDPGATRRRDQISTEVPAGGVAADVDAASVQRSRRPGEADIAESSPASGSGDHDAAGSSRDHEVRRTRKSEDSAAATPADDAPAGGRKRRAGADSRPRAGGERLAKRLQRIDTYDTAAAAMSRLVELWTGRTLTPAEVSSGSLDLQLFGARRGLRYVSAELTAAQLQALDLPAVVELRVGEEELPRYVLVESLDDDRARLHLDRPYRVDRRSLESLWSGSVHVLWRDPERLSKPLSKGSTGPAVQKLQTLLAEAGYLEGAPSGSYDEATGDAVRRLQADRGLQESGEATTLTQIILYNVLRRFERPDLIGPSPALHKDKSVS